MYTKGFSRGKEECGSMKNGSLYPFYAGFYRLTAKKAGFYFYYFLYISRALTY